MKPASYYIKVSALMILLLLETYFLVDLTYRLVQNLSFIIPPLEVIINILLLMLFISYTYALTVGAWDKWEQFLIVPLPITLGIFIFFVQHDVGYAILISLIAGLLLIYDIYQSSRLSNLLIKFDAALILKFSTKGILFIFSALAAVILLMNATPTTWQRNINFEVNKFIEQQTNSVIQKNFGLVNISDLNTLGLNPAKMINDQVNSLFENYKQFVTPLMMLLIFSIYQFVGAITYLIFAFTIPVIFMVAKKTGYFKAHQIEVIKEKLSFVDPES